MQETNEVIEMLPEEKYGEVLRISESRQKTENYGAGIHRLVMSFDGKTYKSGIILNEGTRVKRRDRLIHENSNKCHVHKNICKGRYKEIWREGGGSHGKMSISK